MSPQAVRKAIADGRIKEGASKSAEGAVGRPGWMINPEVANQEWARNTSSHKAHGDAIRAGRQRQMNGGGDGQVPSKSQAETIKAVYQAKLFQLEFEEKSGLLVRVEEMKRQRFETGRRVRDAVLRIGPQMIGEIAKACGGLTPDQRTDVLMIIERYQVQALEALADGAGQG